MLQLHANAALFDPAGADEEGQQLAANAIYPGNQTTLAVRASACSPPEVVVPELAGAGRGWPRPDPGRMRPRQ